MYSSTTASRRIRRQLLAELDESILAFEKAVEIKKNNESQLTRGQHAIKDRDPAVTIENWVLNNQEKSLFIEQLDVVYEIRFLPTMRPAEITYTTTSGKNDGNFLREGFVQISLLQFNLAFEAISLTVDGKDTDTAS